MEEVKKILMLLRALLLIFEYFLPNGPSYKIWDDNKNLLRQSDMQKNSRQMLWSYC